jgi:hypothetical protein
MDELITNAPQYLLQAFLVTFGQLFVLLGPGLPLVFCLHLLSRSVLRLGQQSMGQATYWFLFGWLGALVHETAHALFALLFGHTIVRIAPTRYVQTRYSRHNVYQQVGKFFIGIAPILFGTLIIYCAFYLLVTPDAFERVEYVGFYNSFDSPVERLGAVIEQTALVSSAILSDLLWPGNLLNWKFYLFLYIAFAVSSMFTLSSLDIESALSGFSALVMAVFVFNIATLWLGTFGDALSLFISRFYGFFFAVMVFAVVLNLLVAAILLVAATVVKGAR